MSPILKALDLGIQAAADGFDWGCPLLAMEKVQEEVAELIEALQNTDPAAILDELGDVLFSVVQVARLAQVDPTAALEHANQKFIRRYAGMQELSINQKFADLSLQEQTVLWQRVKEDSV
jgi:ATP diphosphatase